MVRRFLAAFAAPKLEELVSFFSDDAVFIDGLRGVHRGVDVIRSELEAELAMGYGTAKIDVHSLVASGGTVMMEGRDSALVASLFTWTSWERLKSTVMGESRGGATPTT